MNVRWSSRALTFLLSLSLLGGASSLGESVPQPVTRIEAIRKNLPLLEKRTIEGLVMQHIDSSERTTSFYIIKDDYGSVIRVLTSQELPEVNAKYRVTGIVSRDSKRKHLYLDEKERTLLKRPLDARREIAAPVTVRAEDASAGPVPPSIQPAPREPVSKGATTEDPVLHETMASRSLVQTVKSGIILHPFWSLAIGVLALTFFGTLMGATLLAASRGRSSVTSINQRPAPAPEETLEGSTIKIHAPPPGTLKLLPGRLEVVSGDDTIHEIRFYKSPGQTTPEITFGRTTGAPYRHVQLKPMTVSAQQARMTFFDGSWALTNLAKPSSNPTRLNGRQMDPGETARLSPGDQIEMGEVMFNFHAS